MTDFGALSLRRRQKGPAGWRAASGPLAGRLRALCRPFLYFGTVSLNLSLQRSTLHPAAATAGSISASDWPAPSHGPDLALQVSHPLDPCSRTAGLNFPAERGSPVQSSQPSSSCPPPHSFPSPPLVPPSSPAGDDASGRQLTEYYGVLCYWEYSRSTRHAPALVPAAGRWLAPAVEVLAPPHGACPASTQ